MSRIGLCPRHRQMSKSLLRIEGMTSPAKLRDKMSEMLKADLIIRSGKIVKKPQAGGAIGGECRFPKCDEMCTNAMHGVCGRHRFFLRLIEKLPNPHHRQYCCRIEESIEELGECQVPDCLKIAQHMDLCKHHFFRYSEVTGIPDKAPTVAHNKRIEMVATATETSYEAMSADVRAYLQQQDLVISGPVVDIVSLEQELQSLQLELNEWTEMKAEAEAAGLIGEHETGEIEKLQAEIAHANAQLAGLLGVAGGGGTSAASNAAAAGGANEMAGEDSRARRSMLDVQVPEGSEVQQNLLAAPGSAVEEPFFLLELAAGERTARVRLEEEAVASDAETARSEGELASVRSEIDEYEGAIE